MARPQVTEWTEECTMINVNIKTIRYYKILPESFMRLFDVLKQLLTWHHVLFSLHCFIPSFDIISNWRSPTHSHTQEGHPGKTVIVGVTRVMTQNSLSSNVSQTREIWDFKVHSESRDTDLKGCKYLGLIGVVQEWLIEFFF